MQTIKQRDIARDEIAREEVARAEALMAEGWPAAETRRIGEWICQLDAGVTRRANSVLPLGGTDADPETAIVQVEALYSTKGLPPVFKISPAACPKDLDARLAARGYREEGHALVLGRLIAGAETAPQVPVRLEDRLTPLWAEICHGTEPDRAVRDAIVGRIRRPHRFALAEADGEAAAAGLGVVLDDWLLITALVTRPALRRRGAARAVIAALAGFAAGSGARRLILQVERDNLPARSLYAGLGWAQLYSYAYRVRCAV